MDAKQRHKAWCVSVCVCVCVVCVRVLCVCACVCVSAECNVHAFVYQLLPNTYTHILAFKCYEAMLENNPVC